MRKDGTHTESELKRLDRMIKESIEKCAELLNEHKSDRVGFVMAYGRADGNDKDGDSTVALKLKGKRSCVVMALSTMFGNDPDLFFDVIEVVSKLRPEIFRIEVMERPRPDGITS